MRAALGVRRAGHRELAGGRVRAAVLAHRDKDVVATAVDRPLYFKRV